MLELTESSMLRRLLELGKGVLSESDLDRVLTIAIDEAIEITGAERGLIILFGEDGHSLFQAARKLDQRDLARPGFEVSRTIIERVKSEGTTAHLSNALDDPRLKKSSSTSRLAILSVICLPLRHCEDIFGVVYLDNRTMEGAFTDEVCRFAEGFADFISLAAHSALEAKKLLNHVSELEAELRRRHDFEAIVGHHPKMVEVLKLITRIADTDATVLIQGESGTGKELVARALHDHSGRRDRPFVPINCGALPQNLIESELFGHVRGAFTGAVNDKQGWFERADGGTVFLDEVSEMPPELQVRLLRVLQTGEYSRVGSTDLKHCEVRMIAATNRDLNMLVAAGKFREDLYYRLNVILIDLPPLRERTGDIPILTRHFVGIIGRKYGKPDLRLSRKADACLMAHRFPGNVRELENIIQRAVVLAEGGTIESGHFPAEVGTPPAIGSPTGPGSSFKTAKQQLIDKFERDFIADSLKASNGNISLAARRAGLHLKNFYEKMIRYEIDPHLYRAPKK